MAGHSQFKNIMHRKGAQDARRAKIFTKIGREIVVAAKTGGTDPGTNTRLRAAIAAARTVNMPNDRIKRAIEQGAGTGNTDNYEEVRYEGYAPGGIAVIVDALTDNRNRTAGEVRSLFSKYDGNMGETNSVSFMFDRVGEIVYPPEVATSEALFEFSVEAGASNCESDDSGHVVHTDLNDFAAVRESLEKKFGAAEKSGFVWKPNVMIGISEEQAQDVMKLIGALEDCDDVQNVTTNLEVSDDVMCKLAAS